MEESVDCIVSDLFLYSDIIGIIVRSVMVAMFCKTKSRLGLLFKATSWKKLLAVYRLRGSVAQKFQASSVEIKIYVSGHFKPNIR
jgi:hypothetical protein